VNSIHEDVPFSTGASLSGMMGHVLLVDDDVDVRDGLVELLAGAGHRVRSAPNGSDALALLKSLPRPCLVILDLAMPVLDGEGFLGLLLSRADREDFPVVVMSADPRRERVRSMRGVVGVLPKPAQPAELLELVQRHCAQS
jgi:CheY-like chemotaxis protein